MILFPLRTSNSTFSVTWVSSPGKKVFCKKVAGQGILKRGSLIIRSEKAGYIAGATITTGSGETAKTEEVFASFSAFTSSSLPVPAFGVTPTEEAPEFARSSTILFNVCYENMGEESTKNTTPVITDAAHLKSAYPEFVDQIVADAVKAERERLIIREPRFKMPWPAFNPIPSFRIGKSVSLFLRNVQNY